MDFRPDAALDDLGLSPASTDGVEPTYTCWNAMLGEAQKVLHVTLEELAALAGLPTAAIDTPAGANGNPGGRSASLLPEPAC